MRFHACPVLPAVRPSAQYFNISTDDALQLVRYMASPVPTYVREYGL
jgi:hypothetical protein